MNATAHLLGANHVITYFFPGEVVASHLWFDLVLLLFRTLPSPPPIVPVFPGGERDVPVFPGGVNGEVRGLREVVSIYPGGIRIIYDFWTTGFQHGDLSPPRQTSNPPAVLGMSPKFLQPTSRAVQRGQHCIAVRVCCFVFVCVCVCFIFSM